MGTMKEFGVGQFVRYTNKNELGLIGEVTEFGARVWYHLGGTRSMSPYPIIEPLTDQEALSQAFSNERVKASLLERKMRLQEGGDVSDLIDERHIRKEVYEELEKYSNKKEETQ